MKLNKHLAAAAVAASLTLGVLPQALAQPGPGGHGKPGRLLRGALASLDLTETQKTQIKAKIVAERDTIKPLREQMKADHDALRAAAEAPNADAATVGKAFLKVQKDREAIKAEMQKVKDSIASVLTPEQQAKLDGYLSAMHPRRHGRPGGDE